MTAQERKTLEQLFELQKQQERTRRELREADEARWTGIEEQLKTHTTMLLRLGERLDEIPGMVDRKIASCVADRNRTHDLIEGAKDEAAVRTPQLSVVGGLDARLILLLLVVAVVIGAIIGPDTVREIAELFNAL